MCMELVLSPKTMHVWFATEYHVIMYANHRRELQYFTRDSNKTDHPQPPFNTIFGGLCIVSISVPQMVHTCHILFDVYCRVIA